MSTALPLRILAAIAFLLSAHVGFAQQFYSLQDVGKLYRLDEHVEILVDESNTLTFSDILHKEQQDRFKRSDGNFTFGYLKSNLWIKVQTQRADTASRWLLEIPAPFLEDVVFHQKVGDSWPISRAGYYQSQSIREVSHTSYVLPLSFMNDRRSTVYIKIAGSSPKTFPLYAIEESRFNAKTRYEDIGYGIFFGILVVMFVYNLLLYLALRHTTYLLYICTIVCTFLIFAAASGYGGKFLWPEHPMMNFYAGRLSLPVMIAFLTVFAIRFLDVKRTSTGLYYMLVALLPLSAIAFLLVVSKVLPSAGNNLVSLATVAYLIAGIICAAKGNKTAYFFVAAWAFYLVGGLLLTLRNSGVFPFNFWTTHFVEIGAALETMIIAFALGDRYRRYKKEKEEVQSLALKAQQEAKEKLEVKVRERTEQLSRANEELQAMLETNRMQTRMIENKNAELDSFFYRISHDLKGPISSLLGLASLARHDVKDEKALEYLEKQQVQVERLKQIINGLINLTKLGHEDAPREKIDFHKLVEECIASFNALPRFENIRFKKEIEANIAFECEWSLMNAILQNLIENAIKYAREDSAYVHIRIRKNDRTLLIEVEDNGQGIASEHQPRIFDMFFRATQRASGTGLGLYILKRSVERLNGAISVKSAENVGSVFSIALPLTRAPQPVGQ